MVQPKREPPQSCNNLGLASTAEDHLESASPDHRCYLWNQKDLIDLSHQERYCLTSSSRTCPWLRIGPAHESPTSSFPRPTLTAGIAAAIALVLLSAAVFVVSAYRGKTSIELAQPATERPKTAEALNVLVPEPAASVVSQAPNPQQRLSEATTEPPNTVTYPPKPGPAASGESALPSITTLADGASEAVLTYTEAGRKTVYLKVPSDWNLTSAQLDVSREAYAVPRVDQKNEASSYDSTWGVRAQQFSPAGSILTYLDLFLTRTSARPGNLTVEIRDDDGKGFPSTKVLTSVSKPVRVGGYRWEEFDFPDITVEPGRPYWIVDYAGALADVGYPATPSVGDYGYYIGMSLRDEYAQGDSADFLTFTTGPRWEKFADRKSWDLMFRTHTLVQYFPASPRLYVGDREGIQLNYPAQIGGTVTTGDLSPRLAEYLLARRGATEEELLVPVSIESLSAGVVRISNIRIAGKAAH